MTDRARNRNKHKAIFLDRDGVLNKYKEYLTKSEDVELYAGTADAIKKINDSEYLAIVISNQSAVARGKCPEEDIQKTFMKLYDLLAAQGAYLDGMYYCPHHTDGSVQELKFDCLCRKPKTGMIDEAVKDFDLNLAECFMIGDNVCDIEVGHNAGLYSILKKSEVGVVFAGQDQTAETLLEAIDFVFERSNRV